MDTDRQTDRGPFRTPGMVLWVRFAHTSRLSPSPTRTAAVTPPLPKWACPSGVVPAANCFSIHFMREKAGAPSGEVTRVLGLRREREREGGGRESASYRPLASHPHKRLLKQSPSIPCSVSNLLMHT